RLTGRRISNSILLTRFIRKLGMKMPPMTLDQGSTDSYQPSLTTRMDSRTSTRRSSNTEAEQDPSDPAGPGSKPAGNAAGKENRIEQEESEDTGSRNFV